MMVIRNDFNNDKYGWFLEICGDAFFGDVGDGGDRCNEAGTVI